MSDRNSALSIDGQRIMKMEYQSLTHDMVNLLYSDEVRGILEYDGNLVFIYKKGLFDNPSFLAFRIYTIFGKIRLGLPEQQEDILIFFFWLRDMFLPFLARAERFIPDVRSQVDQYLQKRNVRTIANILEHVSNSQLSFIRCIFVVRVPPPPSRITDSNWLPRARRITGLAMAQLYENHFEVSPAMAASVCLTVEQLTILLFNLKQYSRNQGKAFYGKLLKLSLAQNFLIERLVPDGNLHCKFFILMRVLMRLFV
jgi:hypothetical protein